MRTKVRTFEIGSRTIASANVHSSSETLPSISQRLGAAKSMLVMALMTALHAKFTTWGKHLQPNS
jgi:hypothetical protein